ncbi:hypothetical protein [Polymorphobacter megasporae]|uniref:hypothetical protein n=1 Tax=Glacieibacterium megasporae TaxID=2835787 RepID=UPI001C1DFE9D|nr:hypothetical protein [Polymorphobacter megasporae]UAJ09707.1 hypothetical protein KTC28_15615 [Polymorphobacter megasporae]
MVDKTDQVVTADVVGSIPVPPPPPPYPDPPPPPPPSPNPCFLTTAAVRAMGMADDSEPLQLARGLRDGHMDSLRDRQAVALYYQVAPLIVARSTDDQWVSFWQHHMKPITGLIKAGKYDLAQEWYTFVTASLINARALRYTDRAEVDAVYAYGLRGVGQKQLPYGVRFLVLKAAMRVELIHKQVRLAFRKRSSAATIAACAN